MEHKPHINQRKKQQVEQVKKLLQEYPVIAVADLNNLPAANLQKIKKSLRGKCEFIITQRRRILFAIQESREKIPNADELLDKMKGMVALLFSKEDPFTLYKIVQKNISPAPAKAGQESPEDITIPAGPTSFVAGPMIGELGQLGLKTEVKDGKIAIKEDKVVLKQGQVITQKVAELLTKFGIEPMKIGLNITCTYQKGEILGKEILGVSEEEYIGFMQTAHREALNLAVFIAYPSKETIGLLIQKAEREGKGLASTVKYDEEKQKEEKPSKPIEEKKELPKEVPSAKEAESPRPVQSPQPQPEARKQVEPVKEKQAPQQTEAPAVSLPQPKPTPAPEQKKPVESPKQAHKEAQPKEQKSTEEVAQEVLKRLQDEKMKQADSRPKAPDPALAQQEKDLNKIINKLKDQQSKGKH